MISEPVQADLEAVKLKSPGQYGRKPDTIFIVSGQLLTKD